MIIASVLRSNRTQLEESLRLGGNPNMLNQVSSAHMVALTPSLPQPVKFPGGKVHAHACKQYIFRSYSKSNFNAVRFTKIHSHANAKKKRK